MGQDLTLLKSTHNKKRLASTVVVAFYFPHVLVNTEVYAPQYSISTYPITGRDTQEDLHPSPFSYLKGQYPALCLEIDGMYQKYL